MGLKTLQELNREFLDERAVSSEYKAPDLAEPVPDSASASPEPLPDPALASPEPVPDAALASPELVPDAALASLESVSDSLPVLPEPFADLVTGLTELLVDLKSPSPVLFADLLTDLNELLADLTSGSSEVVEELSLTQPEEPLVELADVALLQPEPVADCTPVQPESPADVASALPESLVELMPNPALEQQLPMADSEATIGLPKRSGLANLSRSGKKTRSPIGIVSDLLFFLAIGAILLSALGFSSRGGAPKMFMGFSYFTVLTSSMQSEIPKASFILVRHIDPQKIKVGDVVTYMLDANTSVTHKVINIYDNYNNSGARGFQTKGVNNPEPDKDIVYAANIVGKVIFSVPVAGAVISYLAANLYLVFILFGLCMVISFSIRGLLNEPGRKDALGKS